MTEEDVLEAKKLVQKFHMVFLKNDFDLRKTDKLKYTIKVTDPTPFKERYRRIPPSQCQTVKVMATRPYYIRATFLPLGHSIQFHVETPA